MILSDDDLKKRMTNPMNLLNKPKGNISSARENAMSLFIKPSLSKVEEKKDSSVPVPALTPAKLISPFESLKQEEIPAKESALEIGTDELIEDADARINLAAAHNNAIAVMNTAIGRVKNGIEDIDVRKLPGVITAMSRVVSEIQKTKLEHEKINKGTEVFHHFYMPEQKKIEAYEVIEVSS